MGAPGCTFLRVACVTDMAAESGGEGPSGEAAELAGCSDELACLRQAVHRFSFLSKVGGTLAQSAVVQGPERALRRRLPPLKLVQRNHDLTLPQITHPAHGGTDVSQPVFSSIIRKSL